MNILNSGLGWMFAALAIVFLLGLLRPFQAKMYPGNPGTVARAAAPVLFSLLAVACFLGAAIPALGFIVVAGTGLIITNRLRRKALPLRH